MMWAFGYGIVPSLIFGFSGTIIQRFLEKLQFLFGCKKRKPSAAGSASAKDKSADGSVGSTPARSYTPSDQDNSCLVQIEDF